MASPSEKLTISLRSLHSFQKKGVVVIRSADLTRTHRERLVKNGFLQEVFKGWYIPSKPDEPAGETTTWYAAYWQFCAAYLNHRFKKNWCLSPEQSLLIHAGNWTVPQQLLVRSPKAQNNIAQLLHGTSILDIRSAIPSENETQVVSDLRLLSLSAALVSCSNNFFKQNAIDARAALLMIRDASEVLNYLLDGGHSVVAGRLAGAFRNIGKNSIADEINDTMQAAGYSILGKDPFETSLPKIVSSRLRSPYVHRIYFMWQEMRTSIATHSPHAPPRKKNIKKHLEAIDEIYITDAYHSLSIEGYHVTPELIERAQSGYWNPDLNENDRERRNALAARGYWQAYQAVRKSLEKVLRGDNPGFVVRDDHRTWYREMFAPSIMAGLLKPSDLAGYRNSPVYIRRSTHVPPNHEAVRDIMPIFFELLSEETEPFVRVVLGHFIFVYIHPYIDGNGRMGRFLMNVMMVAGGYDWLILPVEKRGNYMAALETASTQQDIKPFTDFLLGLIY